MTSDAEQPSAALERMRGALSGATACGPSHRHVMKGVQVVWFRHRYQDALHIFTDGVVIGELDSAGQPGSDTPVSHDRPLPTHLPPLVDAVRISEGGEVTPANTTNVFVSERGASDSQIALGLFTGAAIDPVDVAVLAGAGFLPGNETLFEGLKRIPLWHRGRLGSTRCEIGPIPDDLGGTDEAMVQRLVDIVPQPPRSAIAMSGGIDSRFVLGVLLRAGVRPHAYTRYGNADSALAVRIAEQTDLECTVIDKYVAEVADEHYTLLTDAQIYFRGGRFSRFNGYVPDGTVLHTGLGGEGLVKTNYKSVWKKPGSKHRMFDRLIELALTNRLPPGIRGAPSSSDLHHELLRRLDYQTTMVPLETRAQTADWFFYVNRSARWVNSHTTDAPNIRSLSIMTDGEAFMCSQSAGAWSNFAHQRARRLNAYLLPQVDVPYLSGLPVVPPAGLPGVKEKLHYEFLVRGRVAASGRKEVSVRERSFDAAGDFFSDPTASSRTARVAATIDDLVRFLDDRN